MKVTIASLIVTSSVRLGAGSRESVETAVLHSSTRKRGFGTNVDFGGAKVDIQHESRTSYTSSRQECCGA
jgi:hypothetical protein